MGGSINLKVHLQAITTHDTAGRVQHVGVANVTFGVKGALHRQWAPLGTVGKHGFSATLHETEA
jgi:hypothetical protein